MVSVDSLCSFFSEGGKDGEFGDLNETSGESFWGLGPHVAFLSQAPSTYSSSASTQSLVGVSAVGLEMQLAVALTAVAAIDPFSPGLCFLTVLLLVVDLFRWFISS
jgi:hypothetical protein